MFEIRKRQLSITALVAEAEEAVRMALETHHGTRIKMGLREIDPGKKKNKEDSYRWLVIDGFCTIKGKEEHIYAELDMMKKGNGWMPDRALMSVTSKTEHRWYCVRWESRENSKLVVLVIPQLFDSRLGDPYFEVGDCEGNRWTEPLYPKK